MSDEKAGGEPTLVEKWIRDQQEWHRMAMEYYDSMVNNEEFLTHLGNAMRGSLLAGKAYPGTEPPEKKPEETTLPDPRVDELLHTLHRMQGELADLRMTVAELEARQKPAEVAPPAAVPTPPTPPTPPAPESPGVSERGEG